MDDADEVMPVDPDLAPSDPAQPSVAARPRPLRRRGGRVRPDVLAVISLGGMVGATARYGLAQALPTAPGHFPWATFWTNLSGSFVLGFFLILVLERFPPTRYLRPFVATGILGAYTTMSTYLVETAVLLKDGHAATALLYGLATLVIGVALAAAGIVAARVLPRRPGHPPTEELR